MEAVIAKARSAWRWTRKNWKAALAGLSVLLVLIFTGLKNRHRRQATELKGKAREAEGGKVERIKDANAARHKAAQHGRKANEHQERAKRVIERLERKSKDGRMGAAEAEELTKRIAGEG